MKRTNGARIIAVAAIAAAVAGGALSASASAAERPTTAPISASAPTPTEYCFFTPRGSISHYFSLASGTRVVKGHYDHGETFTVGLPATTTGLDGILYWKLPNGYWIDPTGIIEISRTCETP
jgi:hypothetical protein